MGEHAYVSTACQHQLHQQCRRTCKFCPAGCSCTCHPAGERSPACPNCPGPTVPHQHMAITRTEFDRIQDQLSRVDPYDSTKGGVTGG
jgi:hypothetical protein